MTGYEVWRETGGASVKDSTYDGTSLLHTLSGLTPGAIYRISVRAANAAGESEFSELLEKAASALPAAPADGSLTKSVTLSTKQSIYLQWAKVANQEVETSGYLLWMARNSNSEGSSEFVLTMNGTGNPEQNEHEVTGLQTGEAYRFKLQAINFNGLSEMSPEFTFNACLPPSGQPAPVRIDTTPTSITLGWSGPLDDGGCPITGFAVFRDEGDQGTPSVEVNADSDPAVRSIPTLRRLTVTSLPAGKEGQYVRFAIRAYNREGHVDSKTYTAVLYAAVPEKPSAPPSLVEAESNRTHLTIELAEIAASSTGHSNIQAYSLQIDDGRAGEFGDAPKDPSMALKRVVQVVGGLTYRLRYRALNSVGWGPYSDVRSALAAQAPERPAAPKFVSSTGDSITLLFTESQDDGGSRVTGYSLWVSSNHLAAAPTYSQVAGYTDNQMGYTFGTGDGLVAGTTYSFRLTATNAKGTSEKSDELIAAAAAPISKPSKPSRNAKLSTRTSLRIEWAQSSGAGVEVQGYLLLMSKGTGGDFKVVHNGTFNAL